MASSKFTTGDKSRAAQKSPNLTIVLLGKSGVGKSSCGNIILDRDAFETRTTSSSDPVTLASQMSSGRVGDKRLVVVDTPDLLAPQLTHEDLNREISTITSFSSSGPCVYLLVITQSELSPNLEGMLSIIQEAFGEKAADFTMALITLSGMHVRNSDLITHEASNRLPKALKNKFHLFFWDNQKDQVRLLLEKIDAMFKENKSLPEVFMEKARIKPKPEELKVAHTMKTERDRQKQEWECRENIWQKEEEHEEEDECASPHFYTIGCVRIILIGKSGVGKSATGNTILGKKEFTSKFAMGSVTEKCKKRKARIGTRMVQVIDTPGLFDTHFSSEKIRAEIGKCITMSSPGPHVFLLLLSMSCRFTPEERETVRMIQEIFGECSKAYTMLGFTHGEKMKKDGGNFNEYIQSGGEAMVKLLNDCSGRYHIFYNDEKDNRLQVSSFLAKCDKMIRQNGGSFYTTAMYEGTERQIREREIQLLQEKLEKMRHHNKESLLKKLADDVYRERMENMKMLEKYKQFLEDNRDQRINEIEEKLYFEISKDRDYFRKKAEKAHAVETAKAIRPEKNCVIS